MLRDRYEPMNVLAHMVAPGMELDPVLTQMDTLLDDDMLFQAIKADLAKRHLCTLTDGRPSTPIEVLLRMLVIKHLYGWSYDQTCQLMRGSLVLRQFRHIYLEAVPHKPPCCAGPTCFGPSHCMGSMTTLSTWPAN